MGRIGMLTGGGDCPGLNAVIRAVVRKGVNRYGHTIVGFRDGWRGVLENRHIHLTPENTSGILPRGGTMLGSSRTNPFSEELGLERVKDSLRSERIDCLIAVGGEDTLGVADKLTSEGVHVVGIPKTIDNDLSGTDFTFGFNTAAQICTDAIDRLHTTAESHHRVMLLEVMGRHARVDSHLFGHRRGSSRRSSSPNGPSISRWCASTCVTAINKAGISP